MDGTVSTEVGNVIDYEGASSGPQDFDLLLDGSPAVHAAAERARLAATLGEKVRQARLKRGLSEGEFAMNPALPTATIVCIERGLRADVMALRAITAFLGLDCSVGYDSLTERIRDTAHFLLARGCVTCGNVCIASSRDAHLKTLSAVSMPGRNSASHCAGRALHRRADLIQRHHGRGSADAARRRARSNIRCHPAGRRDRDHNPAGKHANRRRWRHGTG
jgi:hypothetical protein